MKRRTVVALLLMVAIGGVLAAPSYAEPPPWTDGWKSHRVWYDGKAEYAEYEASRVIYGQPRSYTARFFTNKERYDFATSTKANSGGLEAFKFHQRHDAPTPNYMYHFSTMAYVDTQNLMPVKLEMSSQEDCGATFKQFVTQRKGQAMDWMQSSYFPGEGVKRGKLPLTGEVPLVYADALPLVLRSFPFGKVEQIELDVIPTQTDTHLTPVERVRVVVRYAGREVVEVPAGKIDAHVLQVLPQGAAEYTRADRYAFAAAEGADPSLPARLHVMVHMRTADGRELKLKQCKRWAYWEF